MQHVGPGGELLTRPRGKAAAEDDDQAAAAFRAAHPFASEVEVAEAVAKARGGARVSVPYYDLTVFGGQEHLGAACLAEDRSAGGV